MKMVKIAVVILLAQAAAAAAEEARPIAVDIRVEAGSGELAGKAEAIAGALRSGDNAAAGQLLSDLYSGGIRKEAAVPVAASKCCHCDHQAVAVSTVPAQAPAAVTPPPAPLDPIAQYIKDQADKKAEAEAAAKQKKAEAEEKAKKQKEFNLGVTIMVIALLLLMII